MSPRSKGCAQEDRHPPMCLRFESQVPHGQHEYLIDYMHVAGRLRYRDNARNHERVHRHGRRGCIRFLLPVIYLGRKTSYLTF